MGDGALVTIATTLVVAIAVSTGSAAALGGSGAG